MKILIADPHPGVRSALALLLSIEIPSAVILQAGCRLRLLETCAEQQPDCILLDPFEIVKNDPDAALTETGLVDLIRQRCPAARMIGMSSRLGSADHGRRIGLVGWVQKTDMPDVLLLAVLSGLKPDPGQRPGRMDR